MTPPPATGPFRFQRFGHAYHLRIEGVEDLRLIPQLDEALWVATSAPIASFTADRNFLERLEGEGDGRIRAGEVKAEIAWMLRMLADPSGIRPGNTTLMLAAVDGNIEEGGRILRSAGKMLAALEAEEHDRISLGQVRKIEKMEETRAVSEAGVVLPEAAQKPEVTQLLQDVLATVGGKPHPSGEQGVDQEHLERFLAEARELLAWKDRETLSLGANTAEAYTLYEALRPRLATYFSLAEATALDPRVAAEVWPWPEELAALDFTTAEEVAANLARAPIARPRADGVLDLDARINPRDREQLAAFWQQVVVPALGPGTSHTLDRAGWTRLQALFAPYVAWVESMPEGSVESLGATTLRRYTEEPNFEAAVRALLDHSRETALVLDNVRLVERLILDQAYMLRFVNSFVSFPHLYDPDQRALFECGTLIMDGRHFTFSVKVPERTQHAAISDASNMFVLYVEITDDQGEHLHELGVPVTCGGRGNLLVGKRGIFKDIYGNERHARVVAIIDNPISLMEATVAPFKRLGRAVTGKIDKLTSGAEAKLETVGEDVVSSVKRSLQETPPPTAAPVQRSMGGTLAGGGIAVAALGSSAAFITNILADLKLLEILAGLATALLAVALPATISAFVKLRRRDLSVILEGSGWGINARMRLTRSQARTFTHAPPWPANTRGVRGSRHWWLWLLLIAALLTAFLIWDPLALHSLI